MLIPRMPLERALPRATVEADKIQGEVKGTEGRESRIAGGTVVHDIQYRMEILIGILDAVNS